MVLAFVESAYGFRNDATAERLERIDNMLSNDDIKASLRAAYSGAVKARIASNGQTWKQDDSIQAIFEVCQAYHDAIDTIAADEQPKEAKVKLIDFADEMAKVYIGHLVNPSQFRQTLETNKLIPKADGPKKKASAATDGLI